MPCLQTCFAVVFEAKYLHELDLSEQAILKAKQFIGSLSNETVLAGMTMKKFEQVRDLVKGRLKPTLMEQYAIDYTSASNVNSVQQLAESGARTGMSTLLELRGMETQLVAVGELVGAMAATDSTLDSLSAAMTAYAAKGHTLPKAVVKMMWLRHVTAIWPRKSIPHLHRRVPRAPRMVTPSN